MKTLVAITCLAVLAAVGYFFWGEYNVYAAKEARIAAATAQRDQIRRDIYRLAAADPDEHDVARTFCKASKLRLEWEKSPSSQQQAIVQGCKQLGFND